MTSTHIQIPIQTTSPIRCGAGSKCGAGSMNSWPGKWYGPVLKSTFAHHAVRCDLSLAGSWVTDTFNPVLARSLTVARGSTQLWQLFFCSGHPQPYRCGSTVDRLNSALCLVPSFSNCNGLSRCWRDWAMGFILSPHRFTAYFLAMEKSYTGCSLATKRNEWPFSWPWARIKCIYSHRCDDFTTVSDICWI